MSDLSSFATAGGTRLRALRQLRGKSQLAVELEANLGIGYLQRLERGRVQQPARETIERIVDVLRPSYVERRMIFAGFGYVVPFMTPTALEIQQAIAAYWNEAQHEMMPVYLLDCWHRMHAWNAPTSTLIEAIHMTDALIMPRLIFDPDYGFGPRIINQELFFSSQIQALCYERTRYCDEGWFEALIAEMCQHELFDAYWNKQLHVASSPVATRPVAHLQFASTRGLLQFRIVSQPLAPDPRFRLIYWLPADANTLYQYQSH